MLAAQHDPLYVVAGRIHRLPHARGQEELTEPALQPDPWPAAHLACLTYSLVVYC